MKKRFLGKNNDCNALKTQKNVKNMVNLYENYILKRLNEEKICKRTN